MRPWIFTTRILIPLALLGAVAGCGGGGTSSGIKSSGTPPTATLVGVSPDSLTTLSQYKAYTFSASGVSATIGRSIASFTWSFGDGTAVQSLPAASSASTVVHHFQTSGTFTGYVQCVDDLGVASAQASFTALVAGAASPVTLSVASPTAATSLQVQLGNAAGTSITYQVNAASTAGTIPASGIVLSPGETTAVVGAVVANGGGSFSIPVTYQAGTALGSRTVTPTVIATDSATNSSPIVSFPVITITTSGINTPPTVVITTPASSPTSGFTSKPVNFAFTATDADGDPLTYTVDWGDGSTAGTGSITGAAALAGASVPLTHAYADSFTATTKAATVVVSVTDGRITGPAPSKSCVYNITYNTYPTATITTPQASSTLPSATDVPTNAATGLVNPPTATDPSLVVIPIGGKLSFSGTATAPGSASSGSADLTLTYQWNFSGGAVLDTTKAATLSPGEVSFSGTVGVFTPYLVTFTATDIFGRASSAASGLTGNTYKKWVIVDGTQTQDFNLSFLYRQKSDGFGTATIVPATLAANGFGKSVEIFQDGTSNSWAVTSGNAASVVIPVRSNLPFYVQIPAFGSDTRTYMVRIPNAPTGSFADPTLGATIPLPPNVEGFGFQNSTAPFDPTLQIVTAQGFAPETGAAANKVINGTFDNGMTLGSSPANNRWLDRLSVPFDDPSGAIQSPFSSSSDGTLIPFKGYQSLAEWSMFGLTLTHAPSTTPGSSDTLGFDLNYQKYVTANAVTDTFSIDRMQMFRIPGNTGDPYDMTTGPANWNLPSCFANLQPTALATGAGTVPALFTTAIQASPGTTALAGGIQNFPIPYDTHDDNRIPTTPVLRPFTNLATTFSYAEYLWSSVWARPLVLNNALLVPSVASTPGAFAGFLASQPSSWPKYLDNSVPITPDLSTFDVTPSGGSNFLATSPVGLAGALPAAGGVGRFFWTAFTPSYDSFGGAVISRTWLSSATTGLPPVTYTGGAGDATSVFGFIPPQDTKVDKQARNAQGVVTASTGGYRVNWYNPTRDQDGNVVPPDFWVVALGSTHFVLPASYPSVTQSVADPILTDARTFLPSGQATAQANDKVAPGYCWFDVPLELRPDVGVLTSVTVFGVKSILNNAHPAAARKLIRTDWIDAVKTATANISVLPTMGTDDLSFAHKLPFGYPWDIVVVNGAITNVTR